MSDISTTLSAMGGNQAADEVTLAAMGSRAIRLGALTPTTAAGTADAAFSQAISGKTADSTLSASDESGLFSMSGTNLVATAPPAATYTVTVTETLARAANSPRATTVTVTIS